MIEAITLLGWTFIVCIVVAIIAILVGPNPND